MVSGNSVLRTRLILYNGSKISMDCAVRLEEGRTLVPLRPLCALFDTQVGT